MTRLQEHYQKTVKPALTKQFGYKNPHQVPRVVKVVVNMGVGEAITDAKMVDAAARELVLIAGQKPIVIEARRSVATFKLREGMKIGCKVTLRRERMYEFIDRLVTIALPRVRDFRGLNPKSFDGRGNFSMGLKEQIVFPEIDYDKIGDIRGMDISIITTARTDDEGRALLRGFDFPFGAEESKDTEEVKESEENNEAESGKDVEVGKDAEDAGDAENGKEEGQADG